MVCFQQTVNWISKNAFFKDQVFSRTFDLSKAQQYHEYETKSDPNHLKQTRDTLLTFFLKNFKEDDIQETPSSNTLDHNKSSVINILLTWVWQSHADTNTWDKQVKYVTKLFFYSPIGDTAQKTVM